MKKLSTVTGTFDDKKVPKTKDHAEDVHDAYLRPAVVKKVKARRGGR